MTERELTLLVAAPLLAAYVSGGGGSGVACTTRALDDAEHLIATYDDTKRAEAEAAARAEREREKNSR